jgi:ribose-phosphate pyrophosphokinase
MAQGQLIELSRIPHGELGIIVLESCSELGRRVDRALTERRRRRDAPCGPCRFDAPRDTYVIPVETPRFSNGEGKAVVGRSVRGMDVYILSDIGNYSCTYRMFGMDVPMGPDEHFQDIKRVISAIGGRARRVSVIMPFLYGGRQHKRKSRESLDCAVALQELERLGVGNILTFEAHDPRVQSAVPLTGFENLHTTYYFIRALLQDNDDLAHDCSSLVVVSPDTGAMDRAIYYASVLKVGVGLFYKRRDVSRVVNGRNPIVQHEYLGPDLRGRDVLITEDMIASGESILQIVDELNQRGARRIFIAATFALFTEGTAAFNEYFSSGRLTRVYSTNLSYQHPGLVGAPWNLAVDMSPLLAAVIDKINYDESISSLFDATPKIQDLLESR